MIKNGTTANGINDLGNSADSKLDSIKESVKGMVDTGHEKVDQIKTKVMDVKEQVATRGGDYLDQASDFIKANPLKAVGIAFGVGYIGMRLFRR